MTNVGGAGGLALARPAQSAQCALWGVARAGWSIGVEGVGVY
jgi:hypothetical protein